MQKGENAVSVALAAIVLLVFIAVHQRWQPASLKEMASSAEDFILTTAGLRGQVPEISGYEKVKTYKLGRYQAGLYRASPAPLVFAPGRFVVYDPDGRPAFKIETLEGSKEPWTAVYDFAGRHGLTPAKSRVRPKYISDLTGEGVPEMIVGQYSGGDHCCTIATVLELGENAVRVLGRIGSLDGLPFEGLELRKIGKDSAWELIAHRPYRTLCGAHDDAADVLSVYGYVNGQYADLTAQNVDYLRGLLQKNLQKWAEEKNRSLQLLQTIAAGYAELGQREEGKRLFAMNLPLLLPELQKKGVDPNACLEDAEGLLNRLPSVVR
jgi:hypothetical protein